MAGYIIKIEQAGVDAIDIITDDGADNNAVKGLSFKMNTVDESKRNHSNDIRPEIRITGHITEDSKKTTRKLAEWATDKNQKTLYRNVSIIVNSDNNPQNGTTLRHYKLTNMFVMDYEERFDQYNGPEIEADESVGVYELFLAQKNEKDSVMVYDDEIL